MAAVWPLKEDRLLECDEVGAAAKDCGVSGQLRVHCGSSPGLLHDGAAAAPSISRFLPLPPLPQWTSLPSLWGVGTPSAVFFLLYPSLYYTALCFKDG